MPKSSIQQYQEFQQYTNYIDTSDVMLGFYKNQQGSGLEKYFLMIEQWLSMDHEDPENNHPLVIEGDGGVGKKTLLVKWFEYHQSIKPKNKRDLTILHFATTGGNNSNYFYAIYRILIKLREQLNIGQKVELHQEKIRKYFSYWLDVCNQRIENQSFQNVDTIYEKIILVFQGIDYFIDRSNGKQGNIAFWLPKYFPKNVKVIVTADGQSESMRYFNKLNCQKVLIPSDPSLMKAMMSWQSQKSLCVQGQIKQRLLQTLSQIIKKTQVTSLFVKSYLSCLLPEKIQGVDLKSQSLDFLQRGVEAINFEKLKKLEKIQCLFDYLLQFWGQKLLQNEEKFKELIGILVSTQKGLTRSEIISITGISQEELKIFITLFRSFLMNFKELWMIKNDCFKKAINNKYQFHYTELSEKIAQSLKKTPNSVRKLQQQTFHLYSAGNYFKLKQVISDIENFLLLFNPYTKYDLCKYWQKLEQKSFDPVIEYNKAIQGFQMHYHPTSDDLFRIITQISRFLKQFSDFENFYTPSFRHPKIIGNNNELGDIGILGQFKNLDMCYDNEDGNKPTEKRLSLEENSNQNENENSENQEQKKLKKKIKEMYEKIQQGKHVKKGNRGQAENKDVNNTLKKIEKKKKEKVLTVQQLNVEVKLNQQNFRKHYYDAVKPFLQKFCLDSNKEILNSQNEQNQDCEDSDREETESENLVAKIKNIQKEKQKSKFEQLPDLKSLYAKTMEEQFQLNQKPPSNYYYKRWIWMQFPWVCMTMKCDYSDRLRKCFTSPTSYMSVSEERQFTLQALKIALQAKRKKQSILQKSEDLIKKKSNLGPVSVASRYINNKQNDNSNIIDQSNLTFKSKSKKKLEQLAYTTNSFLSLNNLEKQLQSMNLNLKDSNRNKAKSPQGDSKNSLFITSEDKTFEQYSSLLHSFNKKKKKKQFANDNQMSVTGKSRQEGLLPRIKQNVNDEMIGELSELEKNNAMMRKEVDNYLYKNKALAKKLKQLKIIQQNSNNQAKNEKKISETKKKIGELEDKIEKVKNQYAFSLLQHERLNVLIKICQQNKTQNEQAIPDLVLQCNNIKKMINLEKTSINDLNKKIEEIKKLTKKFLQNCYDKVKNEAILNSQISQTFKNRQYFQEEVEKYDEMILDQIEERRRALNERAKSIHEKTEEEKTIQKYRTTLHHEEQENYEKIYNQIKQYLKIEGEQYKNDERYIRLLEGLQKKKELQSIIVERKMQIEELQKKLNNERRDLNTLSKAEQDVEQIRKKMQKIEQKYENEVQTGQPEEVLLKKLQDRKRYLKKVTDIKLSCLGMLNTWYSRLGLQQQGELVITPEFLEKLEQAQALSHSADL